MIILELERFIHNLMRVIDNSLSELRMGFAFLVFVFWESLSQLFLELVTE